MGKYFQMKSFTCLLLLASVLVLSVQTKPSVKSRRLGLADNAAIFIDYVTNLDPTGISKKVVEDIKTAKKAAEALITGGRRRRMVKVNSRRLGLIDNASIWVDYLANLDPTGFTKEVVDGIRTAKKAAEAIVSGGRR